MKQNPGGTNSLWEISDRATQLPALDVDLVS
jgi:hypothetical protein